MVSCGHPHHLAVFSHAVPGDSPYLLPFAHGHPWATFTFHSLFTYTLRYQSPPLHYLVVYVFLHTATLEPSNQYMATCGTSHFFCNLLAQGRLLAAIHRVASTGSSIHFTVSSHMVAVGQCLHPVSLHPTVFSSPGLFTVCMYIPALGSVRPRQFPGIQLHGRTVILAAPAPVLASGLHFPPATWTGASGMKA